MWLRGEQNIEPTDRREKGYLCDTYFLYLSWNCDTLPWSQKA